MRRAGRLVAALLTSQLRASCAQLNEATIAAWERYVESAATRMTARLHSPESFLWTNELPERHSKIHQGEILVAPLSAGKSVPEGLIHHWVGSAFVPDATVGDVLSVLDDYDRYADYFKPFVVKAKLMRRNGDSHRFSMRWLKRVHAVTTALETEWELTRWQVDEMRWHESARATRVQEVRNPGRPDEVLLPPGEGSGYVWRVCGISRYEERDGGVYLELESILLSRDIPPVLRWFVKPIVNRLARSAMTTSLQQAREAVLGQTRARGSAKH